MIDRPVPDHPRHVEWRRPERTQPASAVLRNTFAATILSFSPGFSAAC